MWKHGNTRHVTHAQRTQVRRRDHGTCQHCGQPGTEVDHIINLKAGGSDSPDNLQLLCSDCHKVKTQAEAQAARQAKAQRLRRPQRPHPGLS